MKEDVKNTKNKEYKTLNNTINNYLNVKFYSKNNHNHNDTCGAIFLLPQLRNTINNKETINNYLIYLLFIKTLIMIIHLKMLILFIIIMKIIKNH